MSDINFLDPKNVIQINKDDNLNDIFWINDYRVLFYKERLTDFFPTVTMTLIEKLNAIFRMSIYLSVALYLISGKYQYLFIMVIIGAFTSFIFYTQKNNVELYFNSEKNNNENLVQENIFDKKKNKIVPSTENPFMNINLITDSKIKEAAPPSWNDDTLKEKIEDKFGYNLYRDVGDLYGKSNSQRQFYTAPSTTIPNNQTSFAKWCYSVGPTCKEKSIYCSPEMNQVPYLDTQDPYLLTNTKY
jgi:hypothetical protein